MSNVKQLRPDAERYDEASVWIARLDRELSAVEQQALLAWMRADAKNEAVLLEMARVWDKADSLARLSYLFPPAVKQQAGARAAFAGFALAASVLLAVFLSVWAGLPDLFLNGRAEAEHVYRTAVGERSTVILTDGTQLVLNTDSQVHVDYSATQRLLTLTRGEIYVKVAKDKARPLSVLANGKVVQAVGTEFNVEITNDQKIELVVTEGKVRVGVHAPVSQVRGLVQVERLPASSPSVSAGQRMVIGEAETPAVAQVSSEDINVKLSWQQGNLVFRGESLEEAVKEVGRYTSVEFVILDDSLRKVRVAGMFKAGDVDSLLAALRENFDIVSQRLENQKILLTSE